MVCERTCICSPTSGSCALFTTNFLNSSLRSVSGLLDRAFLSMSPHMWEHDWRKDSTLNMLENKHRHEQHQATVDFSRKYIVLTPKPHFFQILRHKSKRKKQWFTCLFLYISLGLNTFFFWKMTCFQEKNIVILRLKPGSKDPRKKHNRAITFIHIENKQCSKQITDKQDSCFISIDKGYGSCNDLKWPHVDIGYGQSTTSVRFCCLHDSPNVLLHGHYCGHYQSRCHISSLQPHPYFL